MSAPSIANRIFNCGSVSEASAQADCEAVDYCIEEDGTHIYTFEDGSELSFTDHGMGYGGTKSK